MIRGLHWRHHAAVAQWIEYFPPKEGVVGSSPASRTIRYTSRPMDKLSDVERKLEAAQRGWKIFRCSAYDVRLSIIASLMGIRKNLQQPEPLSKVEATYQRKRCDDVHEQVRTLIGLGDLHHAKMLRRIVRGYEKRLDEMLGIKPSRGLVDEDLVGSGEGVDVGDETAGDGDDVIA